MHTMRNLRQACGLSLRQLSNLTDIPFQRLSEVERGRRQLTPVQLHEVEKALRSGPDSLPPVPLPHQLFRDADLDSLTTLQADAEQLWSSRWPSCQRYLEGLDLHVPLWFQRATRTDADTELVAWSKLIAAGAQPAVKSPVLAGFLHPIVDGLGIALGNRLKTCLEWSLPCGRLTLWPQISLRLERVSLRVDALILLESRGRRSWCILELDGPQHSLFSDQARDRALGVPVMRMEAKLAFSYDFARLVQARLEDLWPSSRAIA